MPTGWYTWEECSLACEGHSARSIDFTFWFWNSLVVSLYFFSLYFFLSLFFLSLLAGKGHILLYKTGIARLVGGAWRIGFQTDRGPTGKQRYWCHRITSVKFWIPAEA